MSKETIKEIIDLGYKDLQLGVIPLKNFLLGLSVADISYDVHNHYMQLAEDEHIKFEEVPGLIAERHKKLTEIMKDFPKNVPSTVQTMSMQAVNSIDLHTAFYFGMKFDEYQNKQKESGLSVKEFSKEYGITPSFVLSS